MRFDVYSQFLSAAATEYKNRPSFDCAAGSTSFLRILLQTAEQKSESDSGKISATARTELFAAVQLGTALGANPTARV